MKCPSCNKKVELTNKRYFKSLLGKHDCPYCLSQFKLKHTKIYFLWIFLSIAMVIGGSFFILNFVADRNSLDIFYGVWLMSLFFIYCYIDRKIENNMPTIEIK